MIKIKNQTLEADITPWRGELVGLRDRQGREFLWPGDPAIWNGSSPILFPIVGRVPDDQALIGGKTYPLSQHGFAPASTFDVLDADYDQCMLRLASSEATRSHYPFEFTLDVGYRLAGSSLVMTATVTNLSADPMPFSFGFHPGFRWPLPGACDRDNHFIGFEVHEPASICRPLEGLLDPREYPSPVSGRRLALSDALFEDGAIMFIGLRSRALRYGSSTGPWLDISWQGLHDLALWSQPSAHYLCVEPWQGYSALPDFKGELSEKPGIVILPPGDHRAFEMSITIHDDFTARD